MKIGIYSSLSKTERKHYVKWLIKHELYKNQKRNHKHKKRGHKRVKPVTLATWNQKKAEQYLGGIA